MPTKTSVYIPRPQPGFRLHPTSKHAKGRAAKTYQGKTEYGNGSAGQFGSPGKPSTRVKKTFQAKLLAKSAEIRSKLSDSELKAEYAKWRRSMSPEDAAKARELKFRVVHLPAEANGEFGNSRGEQPDVEFHDPADMPEAAVRDHPVDRLEPQSDFAVVIASLGSEEITAAADCFGEALTWALDVQRNSDLVQLGYRAMLMIESLRPDLVGPGSGRPLNWLAAWAGFRDRVRCTPSQFKATGEIFGRLLEWIRRGDKLSTIGERLMLVAYVVRPAMVDSPTLAVLGEVNNKTRQAKDKLVQCLRDTFAGLKAVAMRGETTRIRCQQAHA